MPVEARVFEGSGQVGRQRFITPAQRQATATAATAATTETRRARELLLRGDYAGFAKVPIVAQTLMRGGVVSPTFNFSHYHQRTIGPSSEARYAHLAAWDRVEVVPWSLAELRRLYRHFFKWENDWCTGKRMQAVLSGQARRLKDTAGWVQRGPPFSHAAMRLVPVTITECQAEPKKAIEGFAELAAVAAVAVAAGYMAPALTGAGAAPGATAAGSGASSAAASTAASTTAAGAGVSTGTAASGVGISGAVKQALAVGQKYAGTAETVINSARMADAVANGEMPPPPISFADGNFTDYASAVGKYMLEQKMRRQATEHEEAMIALEAENARRWLAANEQPHAPIVNSDLHPILQAAQRRSADAALELQRLMPYIAAAGGLLLILAARKKR